MLISANLFVGFTAQYLRLATVFVDTRLWKTKHPGKRFQNFRQSLIKATRDRFFSKINKHLPSASGSLRVIGTYRHIGSKSTNHSPLAWRREGQKVTLVALIGGFRSDLSTEEILETFPLVFCFPKSRINENGGNGNSEESSRGRSLSYLFNSCSKEREAVENLWKIIDWLLRDYKIRTKRECEKLLS